MVNLYNNIHIYRRYQSAPLISSEIRGRGEEGAYVSYVIETLAPKELMALLSSCP